MEYGNLDLPSCHILRNYSNHLKAHHLGLNKSTSSAKSSPVSLHDDLICAIWLCCMNHHLYNHFKSNLTVNNICLGVCVHVSWWTAEISRYCLGNIQIKISTNLKSLYKIKQKTYVSIIYMDILTSLDASLTYAHRGV